MFPPISLESALFYNLLCSDTIKVSMITTLEHGTWGNYVFLGYGHSYLSPENHISCPPRVVLLY